MSLCFLVILFYISDCAAHIESLVPIVLSVIISEVFVDCVKHAFITKFNDISPDVYRRYRLILSQDMTVSRSIKVRLCTYSANGI